MRGVRLGRSVGAGLAAAAGVRTISPEAQERLRSLGYVTSAAQTGPASNAPNPAARIEVGTEEYDVDAREVPPEERDAVYSKVVAVAPTFAEYQSKTTRVIPVFELTRVE